MATFIDHIIIAVRDLEKAAHDVSLMLGRDASWHGTHPDYGSANVLFRLDNTYLELLAVDGKAAQGWAADMVREHLAEKDESILAVIFGTDDAESFLTQARTKGLDVSDPQAAHGVDNKSGAQRHWRTMFWPREAARGLFGFCIQHEDMEALPMAQIAATTHPKSHCTAVDHVVLQTRDGAAAKNFYGTQLGIRLALEQSRPEWGGDMLFFRCNQMHIEAIANDKAPAMDNWWGMALKTDDIEATHRRMSDAGITVSSVREGRKQNTKVMTVKSHCLNVPTLIIQHF